MHRGKNHASSRRGGSGTIAPFLRLLEQPRTAEGEERGHRPLIYRVGQKNGPFLTRMTHVYDEVGRRSIYQNVELFISSKTNIRNGNGAISKYSWHKFGETILRRKYQLI